MKKYAMLILVILVGIGLGNSIIGLARLSVGYFTEDMIYSGLYLNYVLLLIPVMFVTRVCVILLKRVYIKGSIVSAVITGLLMFWYLSYNTGYILGALYFFCMGVICFVFAIYFLVKIRPESDEKMRLLPGLMKGWNYKKKFKVALILLMVSIVSVAYIISPKKWVCLYVDSDQTIDHTYEINSDVLKAGEQFIIMHSAMFGWNDYKAGWKFYANKSGNAKVFVMGERFYDNELSKETWDIYVDDNLYVHYDADFEYYLNVYGFFVFIIINSLILSFIFLIAGIVGFIVSRKKEKHITQAIS